MKGRGTPTLAEVAKMAGVSPITASRAINNKPGVSDDKRREILRVADELGYVINRVAQRLSGGQTRIIGVVGQLNSAFTSDLVAGIGSVASAAEYEILVCSVPHTGQRPARSIVDLLEQIADGVIALLPVAADYLDTLAKANVPIVTIDESVESPYPEVAADSYQGARMAVEYLARLGHRRIAFVGGDERLASARDRLRAFTDMCLQLGLDRDPALFEHGNFDQAGGFEAARRLLALPKPPTAVFAANDLSAIGALIALLEAGKRVPEDISVIGFDDIPLASQFRPALSTIRQPLPDMARAAVNMLLALIAGLEPPQRQVILPTDLVVRATTDAI